ncbi:unnamed protein product [Arctogadus glacialis]
MRVWGRVAILAAVLLNLTGLHASSCPLEIDPPRVVVPYGGSFSVLCRALTPMVEFIAVEFVYGVNLYGTQNSTWSLKQVDAWDIIANCYVNLLPSSNYTDEQCSEVIPVTVYKYPQNVTITDTEGGTDAGDLDEGILRVFRCDVTDVAPVQDISVTWLIGNRTVLSHHHFNGWKDSKEPRDVTSLFSYEPRREDDGLHIRCQVNFNLGPSVPQIPQTSQRLPLRMGDYHADA